MPITLYHGPASLEKTKLFKRVLQDQKDSKTLLIIPHMGYLDKYKKILSNLEFPVLLGTKIQSLEDFLFLMIKKNLHRGHKADRFMGHYLIHSILQQKNSIYLKNTSEAFKNIQQIYELSLIHI